MKARSTILAVGAVLSVAIAAPAHAAPPTASCIGQALSVLAPAFGGDLGRQISFEARNPETIGAPNLGAAVSFVAHGDRSDCPEEGL